MSKEVTLSGQLICGTEEEASRVRAALRAHIEATRAEPGCISFEVVETEDPLIFQVDERFTGPAAFRAHQARAAESPWAKETEGLTRAYLVKGMP
ncbi:MAG: antibiotic biosynthesis monooxygenase [Sulfitobacter sp.]|nr:antibiotic biosynthesis monooxygenase [Sulfitobacter sp.]